MIALDVVIAPALRILRQPLQAEYSMERLVVYSFL